MRSTYLNTSRNWANRFESFCFKWITYMPDVTNQSWENAIENVIKLHGKITVFSILSCMNIDHWGMTCNEIKSYGLGHQHKLSFLFVIQLPSLPIVYCHFTSDSKHALMQHLLASSMACRRDKRYSCQSDQNVTYHTILNCEYFAPSHQ